MRILGVDIGKKKIGLAMGETSAHIASPMEIISPDGAVQYVADLVRAEKFGMVLVGTTPGSENTEQGERVAAFIKELAARITVPIETFDEHYTSAQATAMLRAGGFGGEDDAVAAMLLLQTYLDTFEIEE